MLLFLKAIDEKGQCREFNILLEKLEVAFDFLSSIVASGSTLQQVYLLDNDTRTDLPIEVFDGQPFTPAIQGLEMEWETALAEPATVDEQTELTTLTHRRMQQYALRIVREQRMINQLSGLLHRAETNFLREPSRSSLIDRYTTMIDLRKMYLLKTQINYDLARKRMNAQSI